MLKWKMKILLHQDADTQLDEKILNWCTVCLYLHGSVHMHLCLYDNVRSYLCLYGNVRMCFCLYDNVYLYSCLYDNVHCLSVFVFI